MDHSKIEFGEPPKFEGLLSMFSIFDNLTKEELVLIKDDQEQKKFKENEIVFE